MIEGAVLDRPVHTVLLPDFHDSQEGTVHFHYLLHGANRLLRAASTLDDHAADLAATLDGRAPDPTRSRDFVRRFVRPGPADVPAATGFVDVLETLVAEPPPAPVPEPAWARAMRPLLRPFANAAAERVRRIKAEHRKVKEERLEEHRRARRLARGGSSAPRGTEAPVSKS
jgi:hypothetical protein